MIDYLIQYHAFDEIFQVLIYSNFFQLFHL